MSTLDVIILSGGQGSRIRSVLGDIPKILAPIGKHVFLDYLYHWLNSSLPLAIRDTYLATCIGHDQISNHIRNSTLKCILSCESKPLGTFGAVHDVVSRHNLNGDLLVVNGDTLFDIDFTKAYSTFSSDPDHPLLVVKRATDSSRYGGYQLVNSELQLISSDPQFISMGSFFSKSSLVRDLYQQINSSDNYSMLDKDFLNKAKAFPYIISDDATFIDIGVPHDYETACTLIPSLIDL